METEKLDLMEVFEADGKGSKEFFLDVDFKTEKDVFDFGIQSLKVLWQLIDDDLELYEQTAILTNLLIAYRTMDFFFRGEDLEN